MILQREERAGSLKILLTNVKMLEDIILQLMCDMHLEYDSEYVQFVLLFTPLSLPSLYLVVK